jgi:hypothetical protein
MDFDIAYCDDDEDMHVREEPYCYDCSDTGTVTLISYLPGGIVVGFECDHTWILEAAPIGGYPHRIADAADDPWDVGSVF